MLHPKEMEILNKMIQAGRPVCCFDIADGEELLFNTIRVYMKRLLDSGYVVVNGQSQRGKQFANLYSVTEKARSEALGQIVEEILKLNYLIAPTEVVAQLIEKMEV